jgi:cellulose biosynthesis protein BcsQ
MNCFELPHGLAKCIEAVLPWFQLVVGLAGLGTFALVGVLVWIIKKVRSDNEIAIKAYASALRDKEKAEANLHTAHINLGAVQNQLAVCQAARTGDVDEVTRHLNAALATNRALESRLNLAREMTSGGDAGFWSRDPGVRMDRYDALLGNSIPIVMLAAQKGGVGKTTLAANLAAAFADEGDRVLAIDLDYQGTMSGQMILQADLQLGDEQSRVDQLFQGDLAERWYAEILQVTGNLHFLPAYYSLETVERREEYRWVLGDAADDVRYRLARALLSDHVRETYKLVIIDAPPRMTLGFINGLCASTHLFVPTLLDAPSANAVGRFAQQFSRLVPAANPFLQFAGIIGTMTNAGPALPDVDRGVADSAEAEARAELGVAYTNRALFIREAVMQRNAPLGRAAADGIAYFQVPATQPIFKQIAAAVRGRLT